jgi:hemolysin III
MERTLPLTKPRLRGVSHELAFFAALGAGAVLIALAPPHAVAAAAIYAVSLATMLGTSALYHRHDWAAGPRRWMRRADHAAIFVLIAGTSTPLTLLLPTHGTAMLALAWGGAALGILQSLFWVTAPRPLVAALYIALGWAVTIFWPALHAALGGAVLFFLLGGALLRRRHHLRLSQARPCAGRLRLPRDLPRLRRRRGDLPRRRDGRRRALAAINRDWPRRLQIRRKGAKAQRLVLEPGAQATLCAIAPLRRL